MTAETGVVSDELNLHHRAYAKLFSAALGQLKLPAEKQQQIEAELRSYCQKNIQDPDDYLNHLGQFARITGINEQGLATYISRNYLKAMEMVRRSGPEAEAKRSNGGENRRNGQSEKNGQGFLQDLVGLTVSGNAVGRFEVLEGGHLKWISADGETVGRSLQEKPDDRSEKASPSTPANVPEKSTAVEPAATGDVALSGKKGSAASIPDVEPSIISTILDTFGDISPGKLEVDPFKGIDKKDFDEKNAAESETASVPGQTGDAVSQIPEASAASFQANISEPDDPRLVQAEKPVLAETEDRPIIQDILEKFRDQLKVSGKLEPATFPESSANTPDSENSGSLASAGRNEEDLSQSDDSEEVYSLPDSLPIYFSEYSAIRKKVAAFQQAADRNGYQDWLRSAGSKEKAIVGIKNLERKSGLSPDLPEYASIAVHLGCSAEELALFHRWTRCFDRVQSIMNKFVQAVQKQPGPILDHIKKVWPQMQLLFDRIPSPDGMKRDLKPILLAVPGSIRNQVQIRLERLIDQGAEAFQQEWKRIP